ncbi:MAG: glycosyltransferase, partial [Nitrospirota bacterium]
LAKKEVIRKIGGLDERFGSGNFEDDDFCIRASLSGYESRVAQDVYIHHTGSQTFKGIGIDYKKSLLNNWKLFKDKWGIPVDTPYEEGYDLPLQPPPGLNVYIPIPDVLIDHQAEDSDGRWVIDLSSKEKQLPWTPALTSIIVLTSDQFAHTKKCIKSLRKNTLEPHEIIVVDNGSSQKTTDWLKRQEHENRDVQLIGNPQGGKQKEKEEEKEKQIQIEKEAAKQGEYAKACNLAISQSSGEYIAILKDDVVVSKGWLQGMLECLKASPDTGIVGPMTINVEGPQNVIKSDYSSPDNLDAFAGAFREKYRYRRVPSTYLADCCMLFRRELVDKTGLFDEDIDFSEFAADDFCFRAALEGYRNIIAADVFIHHYAVGKKEDAAALSLRKKDLFIRKWSKADKETELKLSSLNAIRIADEMSQKGMPEKAIGSLMEAIKMNMEDKRLYYTIAEVLIENMKFTEAQGVLQSLPERIRQEPRWLELAAKSYAAIQSNQEAENYADKVLSMNNASPAALNIKGLVALKKGLNTEAEKFFEKALKADRGFAETYANIGRLKWPSNKETAFTLFEKAFILAPFLSDVASQYYNAVVSLSRFKRAESIFRDAAALYPLNKRLRFFFNDMLLRTGKRGEVMEIKEADIESV